MSNMQSIKREGLRKLVDACMLILLLCLMSYQVTGEEKHEWTGILMTLTVILHQFLNRRWYAALFKGRYNPYRSTATTVNLLLLASMLVTAFCGMSMSEYAVPFLYQARTLIIVRPTHLAMSHWSFVLMGLHLGLHIPLMLGRMKENARTLLTAVGAVLGGVGLWLFLRNGMPNYLFFRVPFAFLDYEKAFWLVFLENALMLGTWAFLGAELGVLCMNRKKKPALILGSIAAAAVLGLALNTAFPGDNDLDFDAAWTVPEAQPAKTASTPEPVMQSAAPTELDDGFVLIPSGRCLMGSPETENWRIKAIPHNSARADPEKIWVLIKALFRRCTLCTSRKSDEIRAQIFQEMSANFPGDAEGGLCGVALRTRPGMRSAFPPFSSTPVRPRRRTMRA